MPLFSFRCASCQSEFETLVQGEEPPHCPACGGAALERLISRVAPEARTPGLVKRARAAAARQGHFSNS